MHDKFVESKFEFHDGTFF